MRKGNLKYMNKKDSLKGIKAIDQGLESIPLKLIIDNGKINFLNKKSYEINVLMKLLI